MLHYNLCARLLLNQIVSSHYLTPPHIFQVHAHHSVKGASLAMANYKVLLVTLLLISTAVLIQCQDSELAKCI